MSEIYVLNRDDKKLYLNRADSDEFIDITEAANWEKLRDLSITLTAVDPRIKERELCLSFVTREEIQYLNSRFRNKDYVTDVLSFNTNIDMPAAPLGDIVICSAKSQEQAWELGYSLRRELIFLFIHGFLHLIGYDHETENDAEEMFALQKKILLSYGILD